MTRRRKIVDHALLREEYRTGMSIADMAARRDCSDECVRMNLHQMGETLRPAFRPRQTKWQKWCARLHRAYPGFGWISYRRMFREQQGRCALCHRKIRARSKKYRQTAVDHNHQTGKVRALLCGSCNNALGNFMDSPEICERAAEYLRDHGQMSQK